MRAIGLVLNKIIYNDFGITLAKKLIIIFTGLINVIFITRWLGPQIRGEYSYILSAVSISVTALNLGISLVYPYYKRQFGSETTSLFIFSALFQFILYLSISFIYLLTFEQDFIFYILLMASSGVLTIQLNQILLIDNIKKHSVSAIIASVFNASMAILLYLYMRENLLTAILLYVCKDLISVALFFYLSTIKVELFHLSKILPILKRGFVPMLTTILIVLNYKIDIIMLRHLNVDFVSIGLFSVGVVLAEYAWFIPDVFKEVMINKNSLKDSIKATTFSLRAALSATLIFIILFILFGQVTIDVLFGMEFTKSYFVTLLMFLAVPFMVFVKIIGTLFIANGKWRLYFYTLFSAVVINIILNYILIPFMGINGAAISSIVSYSFSGLIFLNWFLRNYKIPVRNILFINKSDLTKMLELVRR